jgi:hypothetical protein
MKCFIAHIYNKFNKSYDGGINAQQKTKYLVLSCELIHSNPADKKANGGAAVWLLPLYSKPNEFSAGCSLTPHLGQISAFAFIILPYRCNIFVYFFRNRIAHIAGSLASCTFDKRGYNSMAKAKSCLFLMGGIFQSLSHQKQNFLIQI